MDFQEEYHLEKQGENGYGIGLEIVPSNNTSTNKNWNFQKKGVVYPENELIYCNFSRKNT